MHVSLVVAVYVSRPPRRCTTARAGPWTSHAGLGAASALTRDYLRPFQ
jgi:hypothetical protein